MNSNAEKKIAFTTQERPIETPKPAGNCKPAIPLEETRVHTSIHAPVKKLDLRLLSVADFARETVPLVYALCGVDRIYLMSTMSDVP